MKNKCFLISSLLFSINIALGQPGYFIESFDKGSVIGVKGRAQLFDGYFTEHMVASNDVASSNSFTIEAWIALQEYASAVAAIADKESEFKTGYLFGINQYGKLSGSVAVKGEWITCISTEVVPLLQWAHVTMVVENTKAILLYLNGENVGSIPLPGNSTLCDTCSLSIGKTQTKTTAANTERATSSFIKTNNRFDGLIDELYIYPNVLSANEIITKYKEATPTIKQPLQFRQMPSGPAGPAKFGAVYTQLKYSPGWDALWRGSELPDIVVRFDNSPVRFIFWRGTGYIPAIVNEKNMWMTDQSLEHWGTGECYEAMGDKQTRYSHVRLIENTAARVVIHWRYALAGIKHQLFPEDENGWSDWVDEYWTIYPDGIAARKQVLWSKRYETDKGSMQWQETIFFCQPGTRPQDNVSIQALTFMDMQGNKESYSWKDGPPKLKMFTSPKYQPIEYINFKSAYKPYSIFDEKRVCQPFSFGNMKEYTSFPNWNHWPVQQVMSDGRNAVAPDKPSHSSLTGSNGDMQIVEKKGDGIYWASSLKGMTSEPIDSLMLLAKSWNNAAMISNISSGITAVYDKYQRAYLLNVSNALQKTVELKVNASAASPAYNLPLVLENFTTTIQSIRINNKLLKADKDYAVGRIDGLEHSNTVIFIKVKISSAIAIRIN
ncbi:MAG: LamG domain-containing protein [Chitinophagaceae bacterium]